MTDKKENEVKDDKSEDKIDEDEIIRQIIGTNLNGD